MTRRLKDDPSILQEVLRVAAKTQRPAQWVSVNQIDLDYKAEQIDAAIRVLVDRGWLHAAPMTLHSVLLTAEGRSQVT